MPSASRSRRPWAGRGGGRQAGVIGVLVRPKTLLGFQDIFLIGAYRPTLPPAVGDRDPDGFPYLAGFLRALGVADQDIPADQGERSARYRSPIARRRMLAVQPRSRRCLPHWRPRGRSNCADQPRCRGPAAGSVPGGYRPSQASAGQLRAGCRLPPAGPDVVTRNRRACRRSPRSSRPRFRLASGDLGMTRRHWGEALAHYADLGTPEAGIVRTRLTGLTDPPGTP
jgi:hypothetical protein